MLLVKIFNCRYIFRKFFNVRSVHQKQNICNLFLFVLALIIFIYLIRDGTEAESDSSVAPKWLSILENNHHPVCEKLIRGYEPPMSRYNYYQDNSACTEWANFRDPRICEQFKLLHGEAIWSSEEEIDFPLAFVVMVYEDAQQVARLLRLIYRPQNVYCIHVDKKSSDEFYERMIELAECFGSNVFLIEDEKRIDVQWGYFSNLQPTLLCEQRLLRFKQVSWRYVINTNGKELPLLTNWELVKVVKALNGSNMAEALNIKYFPRFMPSSDASFPVS